MSPTTATDSRVIAPLPLMHLNEHSLGTIATALERSGWGVVDDFLPAHLWRALGDECSALATLDALSPAAIGRAKQRAHDPTVRGDRSAWLDHDSESQRALLGVLDALRVALNRELFLNLGEVEAHFALYRPGAHYARHRDRFRDDDRRVVSAVLYLNQDWHAAEGGALRLYLDSSSGYRDVLPCGGRAVFFLSADFEHEVLPASRDRLSIAAWFRRTI